MKSDAVVCSDGGRAHNFLAWLFSPEYVFIWWRSRRPRQRHGPPSCQRNPPPTTPWPPPRCQPPQTFPTSRMCVCVEIAHIDEAITQLGMRQQKMATAFLNQLYQTHPSLHLSTTSPHHMDATPLAKGKGSRDSVTWPAQALSSCLQIITVMTAEVLDLPSPARWTYSSDLILSNLLRNMHQPCLACKRKCGGCVTHTGRSNWQSNN